MRERSSDHRAGLERVGDLAWAGLPPSNLHLKIVPSTLRECVLHSGRPVATRAPCTIFPCGHGCVAGVDTNVGYSILRPKVDANLSPCRELSDHANHAAICK